MAAVKSQDTSPEIFVRSLLHGIGFRYRLHDSSLLGKPDVVFRSKRKIIFVHGCFWHRHNCRSGRSMPKVQREYWEEKFSANVNRDRKVCRQLRSQGWKIMIIWGCQTLPANKNNLSKKLIKFLNSIDLRDVISNGKMPA
jgi:DNA mismatch endonuclease, patch repair protein